MRLTLHEITFFLSPDFHELGVPVSSVTSGRTGYSSTWMGDRFSRLLMSLMALRLVPVDRIKPLSSMFVTGLQIPPYFKYIKLP